MVKMKRNQEKATSRITVMQTSLARDRDSNDSGKLANRSNRCSTLFLSTLMSCQALAHSYWDDKEIYRT
jgi:hypothetical protein